MKTRTSFLTVVLATLGVFSSPVLTAATSKESPARAHRVTVVERNNAILIERGDTEFAVRRLLGEPLRKLDRDHWTYARFSALPERPATDDCETLLLVFSEGKLIDIKLINDRAEKFIAATLQPKTAERAVAVAK